MAQQRFSPAYVICLISRRAVGARFSAACWGCWSQSCTDRRHQLSRWTEPPERVLLVQKHEDERTRQAMGRLLE